ncbi:glycoprotein integral membrane protein 1 [Gadus chalcogrammus]|uniref:glycoprotein integral membrane protein 1 n=1 Tax=Gadus chalcogrammus TaxID=1042646 RepID=UPI0024C4D311|nr:glycoprotein integral membrane protein 1 [Gadus chalcogrammus]XP_056437659.1 glycoprotein integral membrane protein 1 [Gadus chalcogrammus]
MKSMGLPLAAVFLLLLASASSSPLPKPPTTETILINVTAGLGGAGQQQDSSILQISLNVSVSEEEVLVNQVPVELSGVTRLPCQALLWDSTNGSSEVDAGSLVSAVTRVMVIQNRLYSDYEEVVSLQVFSEVIEVDGQQVQQADMCEVKLLLDPSFQQRARYTSVYPIGHSPLSRAPRGEDTLVPAPPRQRVDSGDDPLVSRPPPAQQEYAAPGRLPEVPLRMARREQEEQQEEEPGTQSSYSAVCVWVQQARERVRRFCSESLPLFFLVMWVVVIGVVGSAVIVKILDLFFPTCEHRRSYHLSEVPPLPEEEKHTLLENMEAEPTSGASE